MEKKSRISIIMLIAACFFVVAGCAGKTHRMSMEDVQRIAQIKVYGIVPPDITIYEIGADETVAPKGEFADKAKRNVVKAVIETYREKGIEARSLLGDVNQEGAQHSSDGVDALIMIKGYDYVLTTGRKVLKTVGGDAGKEKTYLKVEIVDAAGNRLWQGEKQFPKIGYDPSRGKDWLKIMKDSLLMTSVWNVYGDCAYDLLEPEKSASFVKDLLSDYLKSIR